jgi:hypothetical protein
LKLGAFSITASRLRFRHGFEQITRATLGTHANFLGRALGFKVLRLPCAITACASGGRP